MRRWLTVAGIGLASALLVACGSDDGEETAEGPTTPTATGRPITAELTEYDIELSETNLRAGTYTFIVQEKGEAPHAISVSGPGLDTATSDTLNPGDPDAELTVELTDGTYELWCPVGNHRSLGMDTTITVK